MSFLESNAGKFGIAGTLATITAQSFSAWAVGGSALVTIAAVLPVAIKRWRELFKGDGK